MPFGALVIGYKADGGKEHTYTFGVKEVRGGTSAQPWDALFLANIIGPRIATGDYSAAAPGAGTLPGSLLEALLRFLRGLSPNEVEFRYAYLSDGKTPGPDTGPFATLRFSLRGTWTYNAEAEPSRADIAPSTSTVMMAKTPTVIGTKVGRNYLRYIVKDIWTTYDANDGVEFNDTGTAANMQLLVQTALTNTGLRSFFAGVDVSGGGKMNFGQLHFYTKAEYLANPTLKGVIKNVQSIRSWDVAELKNRQVKKGKKRKVDAFAAAQALAAAGYTVDVEAIRIAERDKALAAVGDKPPATDAYDENPDNWTGAANPGPGVVILNKDSISDIQTAAML